MMVVYAVDETNATITESDEEAAEPLPRAARYTRNEMPLLIIRPVSGPIPMSPSNHHNQGSQTRNGAGFYINGPRGMFSNTFLIVRLRLTPQSIYTYRWWRVSGETVHVPLWRDNIERK